MNSDLLEYTATYRELTAQLNEPTPYADNQTLSRLETVSRHLIAHEAPSSHREEDEALEEVMRQTLAVTAALRKPDDPAGGGVALAQLGLALDAYLVFRE